MVVNVTLASSGDEGGHGQQAKTQMGHPWNTAVFLVSLFVLSSLYYHNCWRFPSRQGAEEICLGWPHNGDWDSVSALSISLSLCFHSNERTTDGVIRRCKGCGGEMRCSASVRTAQVMMVISAPIHSSTPHPVILLQGCQVISITNMSILKERI